MMYSSQWIPSQQRETLCIQKNYKIILFLTIQVNVCYSLPLLRYFKILHWISIILQNTCVFVCNRINYLFAANQLDCMSAESSLECLKVYISFIGYTIRIPHIHTQTYTTKNDCLFGFTFFVFVSILFQILAMSWFCYLERYNDRLGSVFTSLTKRSYLPWCIFCLPNVRFIILII